MNGMGGMKLSKMTELALQAAIRQEIAAAMNPIAYSPGIAARPGTPRRALRALLGAGLLSLDCSGTMPLYRPTPAGWALLDAWAREQEHEARREAERLLASEWPGLACDGAIAIGRLDKMRKRA